MVVTATKDSERRDWNLRGTITCLHCWHRFPTHQITYVARHEELRGDPILGDDAYIRFLPTRFNTDGDAIDGRSLACQELACPKCHLIIPNIFLTYEPLFLSLIGVPFSGKSYFLTAMTWELAKVFPKRFKLIFEDVDVISNSMLKDCHETLFLPDDPNKPVGIIKTQLDSATHYDSTVLDGQRVLLPRPLMYNLAPCDNHPNIAHADEIRRVLCMYDNAGEHFLPGQDTTLAPGTQHMAHCRVLMFLFDPTQDPRIREKCRDFSSDPQLSDYSRTQLQATVLTEMASRVRRYGHLPANKKLSQPLMVLVSKSDIWGELIDEDIVTDPYLDSNPALGGSACDCVDIPRIWRVSNKIRDMLLDLTPEFVASAEGCSEEVIYIPISALGSSPQPQENGNMLVVKPSDIKPSWITVPMIYAFSVWATKLVGAKVS